MPLTTPHQVQHCHQLTPITHASNFQFQVNTKNVFGFHFGFVYQILSHTKYVLWVQNENRDREEGLWPISQASQFQVSNKRFLGFNLGYLSEVCFHIVSYLKTWLHNEIRDRLFLCYPDLIETLRKLDVNDLNGAQSCLNHLLASIETFCMQPRNLSDANLDETYVAIQELGNYGLYQDWMMASWQKAKQMRQRHDIIELLHIVWQSCQETIMRVQLSLGSSQSLKYLHLLKIFSDNSDHNSNPIRLFSFFVILV